MKKQKPAKPNAHPSSAYSWDDTLIIPATHGVGIKWRDKDGRAFISRLSGSDIHNGKRVVELSETSFAGYFMGMHYYATLKTGFVSCHCLSEKKTYSMAGYGPEHPDKFLTGLRLDVQRRITRLEKDMSGDPIGKIGDMTYRFNTPDEAKAAAIELFKKRFGPGWILMDDNYSEVFAET